MKKLLFLGLLVLLCASISAGEYSCKRSHLFKGADHPVTVEETVEFYIGVYGPDHDVFLKVSVVAYDSYLITAEANILYDGSTMPELRIPANKVYAEIDHYLGGPETTDQYSGTISRSLIGYDAWTYKFTGVTWAEGIAYAEIEITW